METFNNLLFRNNPILNGFVSIGAIRSVEEIISSIYSQPHCLGSLWKEIRVDFDFKSPQICSECDLFWNKITTDFLVFGSALMIKINQLFCERFDLP